MEAIPRSRLADFFGRIIDRDLLGISRVEQLTRLEGAIYTFSHQRAIPAHRFPDLHAQRGVAT
jgi:hypothetical protein